MPVQHAPLRPSSPLVALALVFASCSGRLDLPSDQAASEADGPLPDDASAERDTSEPAIATMEQLLERLEEPNRDCEQDSDCTLLEVRGPCFFLCDPIPVRAGSSSVTKIRAAVAEFAASCVESESDHPWAERCGTRGHEARCEAKRCVYKPAACSPGCQLDSGNCVGPAGVLCQSCPNIDDPTALGGASCTVLDHLCQYGTCSGYAICEPDSDGKLAWNLWLSQCM